VVGDHAGFAGRFLSIAGLDQDRCRPGALSELDVARLVADHECLRWVEVKLPRGLLEELRSRLAAGAAVLRQVRAGVDAVEMNPLARQQRLQSPVDLVEPRRIEESPSDGGLVGHDDEPQPERREAAQPLRRAGLELQAGRIRQVPAVDDDRAVPIENGEPPHRDGIPSRNASARA